MTLSTADTLLNIQSLNGYTWQLRECNERDVLTLSQRYDLPEILARVLSGRGISVDRAESFLAPSLKQSLPDPSTLKDMDAGAERIAAAVISGEKIGIFGDYDVDGATSSAVLRRYFHALGVTTFTHIPDRMKEGYGPNVPALLSLKDKGATVVITVDCGTVSFEPLAAARDAGLDVIVVDHHIGDITLPPALAVINPNRFDEDSSQLGQLAAVGVTFLLLVAVSRTLRSQGYFNKERREPSLLGLLDLVALGTVCDVVPLTGVNRAFVSQGLKVMATRQNIGLNALSDIARVTEAPNTYHAGFVLGPRINAGGRVGQSSLGSEILSTHNPSRAEEIAAKLDHFNAERKAIESSVLEEAMAMAEMQADSSFICVASEGWHEGVIGIVAGRIKEQFNRPSAVIAIENGRGKASARSIHGVNLGSAVTAAKQSDLLLAGGGHAMAAGFSIEIDKLPAFQEFMTKRLTPSVQEHSATKPLMLDGILPAHAVSLDLAHALQQAAPYGMGNAEPRFALHHCRILRADIVGGDHIRCTIGSSEAGYSAGSRGVTAMAFRCVDTDMGQMLLNHGNRPLNLAGKVRINYWQGNESAQFLIDDVGL